MLLDSLHAEKFQKSLKEMQSTANADQTISGATGILHILNRVNFLFWLKLFHQIMPHLEVIYNQMQSRDIDSCKVQEYIENFNSAIIKEIRSTVKILQKHSWLKLRKCATAYQLT